MYLSKHDIDLTFFIVLAYRLYGVDAVICCSRLRSRFDDDFNVDGFEIDPFGVMTKTNRHETQMASYCKYAPKPNGGGSGAA